MRARTWIPVVAIAAAAALVMPGVQAGGRPLDATLTGAAEVPGPGDPDGSGTAALTLNQGRGEICFEIAYNNIGTAQASHIHAAPAGVEGGVVVGLFTTPTESPASGCVEADPALIKDIRQNPEEYYVNVHTAEFGGGAIRGQLSK